jgi:hypothetical protein
MSGLGMNAFALISLVLSCSAFVAVLIWTCTRSRRELDAHARLWEDDEDRGGTPKP